MVPAVIVSGGGSPGAYDIVRALGLAGIPSIVASSQEDDIAFASRHTCDGVQLPAFSPENDAAIVDRLQRVGRGQPKRPPLFYVGDAELAFVHRHRGTLRPYFHFLLPTADVLTALMNKSLFHGLALKHGLPVPRTELFADAADVQQRLDDLTFPCIVKPSFNGDWFWRTPEERKRLPSYKRALRRFDSKEALLEFCDALPPSAAGLLIQSYVEGGDDAITTFHGYFDDQSNCLGYFLGQEVRTDPPGTGESVYSRTIHDPALARRSIDSLTRIGISGIVKIDYKIEARSNDVVVMEIEPHYQFWHLLGAYAGVNLPFLAYEHQKGLATTGGGDYADDLHMLYLRKDVRAFWLGYRRTGEWTFSSYVKSHAKDKRYRVFDPTDPLPFVRSVTGFVRRGIARVAA
ncbi:MAG: hypothetical protein DMD81_01895 [Candidatus Rokuibacteriota bacterium]|nr:MAG: hypothetical protein DMD81_01895 [Candidatus Rokubacteria bacterium]